MSLDEPLAPAAPLIRRLEPELLANVFRWTGHFPERTRVLVRYLADRAEQLRQGYALTRESAAYRRLYHFRHRARDEPRPARAATCP
jgi:hypothetical protein